MIGDRFPSTVPAARRSWRALRLCLVGALFGAAAVAAPAPSPAGADVADAQCDGTIDQSWYPGLTLVEQTVTYTADLDYECTSSDPDIDGARIHVHAQYSTSCALVLGQATATIRWNTKETSDIVLNPVGVTVGGGAQVYEAVGSVTAGKFAGDTVNMLNTFVSLDLLACLTPQGMRHRSGSTTLTLLGV